MKLRNQIARAQRLVRLLVDAEGEDAPLTPETWKALADIDGGRPISDETAALVVAFIEVRQYARAAV